MKKHLLFISAIFVVLSCSDNGSDPEVHNETKTLNVNNVYVEDPSTNDWVDIIITDGKYNLNDEDNIYYPNDKSTYVIHFLELQFNGDNTTPREFINDDRNHGSNGSNYGTEGVIFYEDMIVKNGIYQSAVDITDEVVYVSFKLLSENSFSFEIELDNGIKYKGSYSGSFNILGNRNSFVPDVYWEE